MSMSLMLECDTPSTFDLLKMSLLFIVVRKIGERLFICLTMGTLWDVDHDVSTSAITAGLHQAMR